MLYSLTSYDVILATYVMCYWLSQFIDAYIRMKSFEEELLCVGTTPRTIRQHNRLDTTLFHIYVVHAVQYSFGNIYMISKQFYRVICSL